MLTANELLAGWLEDFGKGVREAITGLPPEALAWQPHEQSNRIGVTVWHRARWRM